MSDRSDPLVVRLSDGPSGSRLAWQPPPVGAASFSASYVGPAGWAREAPRNAGLARVMTQLLTSGAGRRPRRELARYLDRAGATLSAQAAPESAEVTLWGPAALWRPLLGLLADAVLRPRFDPEDLARVRRQMVERQLRELTHPGSRADKALLERIFPESHPYHGTGLGTARSLRQIGRDSLRRFHQDHVIGNDAAIVFTGPAPRRAVQAELRRAFGELREGSAAPLPTPAPRSPGGRTLIPLPGQSQVEVRLGGPSVPRRHPEFAAVYLANEILGGASLLSRLFQRVRSRGGLAYHASSRLDAMRFGGHWTAQAGTGSERWRKVVPMLEEEVARLAEDPVPAPELRRIRESRIGQTALLLESTSEAHELALNIAYHGLPEDHWRRWPGELRRLRATDLRHAAEVGMDGRQASLVIAGPVDPPRR